MGGGFGEDCIHRRQFANINKLKTCIVDKLRNYKSLPQRMAVVIKCKGGHT